MVALRANSLHFSSGWEIIDFSGSWEAAKKKQWCRWEWLTVFTLFCNLSFPNSIIDRSHINHVVCLNVCDACYFSFDVSIVNALCNNFKKGMKNIEHWIQSMSGLFTGTVFMKPLNSPSLQNQIFYSEIFCIERKSVLFFWKYAFYFIPFSFVGLWKTSINYDYIRVKHWRTEEGAGT